VWLLTAANADEIRRGGRRRAHRLGRQLGFQGTAAAASRRGRAARLGHGARGRPTFTGPRQGEAVPGTVGTAGRGVLTGHGGACARMGFRAGS
jgi:hypothetical protein